MCKMEAFKDALNAYKWLDGSIEPKASFELKFRSYYLDFLWHKISKIKTSSKPTTIEDLIEHLPLYCFVLRYS